MFIVNMYRLFHEVLLLCFKFVVILDNLLQFLHYNLEKYFRRIHTNDDLTLEDVRKVSDLLTKRPSHLAFLLNDNGDIDSFSIANAITWSIALQIPYITVYDRKGHIHHKKDEIFNKINIKLAELLGTGAKDLQLIVSEVSKPYENGIAYPKQVCLQFLSDDDCQHDMLLACQSLSADSKTEISRDAISSRLKVMKNIPDPELLFQFGNAQSLMGFSPWHTHLSEILYHQRHDNFPPKALLNGLLKFSRCEQRFGK